MREEETKELREMQKENMRRELEELNQRRKLTKESKLKATAAASNNDDRDDNSSDDEGDNDEQEDREERKAEVVAVKSKSAIRTQSVKKQIHDEEAEAAEDEDGDVNSVSEIPSKCAAAKKILKTPKQASSKSSPTAVAASTAFATSTLSSAFCCASTLCSSVNF